MRSLLVLRLGLMLVLVLNGLAAAHAGVHLSPSVTSGGSGIYAGMDDMATVAGSVEGSCHDQAAATELPVQQASGPDAPGKHLSCCADMCQCACVVPVLSALLTLPAGPWTAGADVLRARHYASLSPLVLLRPPIA